MSKQLTLDKPLVEASYLTAPNFFRYRSILRFFYLQHQRMKYWMVRDEVFSRLREMEGLRDYTLDQCQQDLDTLVDWKNLMAGQDAGKVQTIEEFKNRRFRYQLTPYTIEIERLMVRLESTSGIGGSLEANLFERISNRIREIPGIKEESPSRVYGWWQDLESDFQRLNQNATDYIARLEGGEAEELMNTLAFLTYKDGIIEYLRTFIRELQRYGPIIEGDLRQVSEDTTGKLLDLVSSHHMTIPRMEQDFTEDEYREEIRSRWLNLALWFVGEGDEESESYRLLDITNGIIRKITRYAYRIAERQNRSISRQGEYMHLCNLFADCRSIDDANSLSAAVFGAFYTRHVHGSFERETESISSGIWEEYPFEVQLKPRTRQYRERSHTGSIVSRETEKKRAMEEYLERMREEQEILAQYIEGNRLSFINLPEIEPFVRNTLLRWVGRAMANKERMGKTEDGRTYRVHIDKKSPRMTLRCQDGNLEMPPMIMEFLS
ncbi:MAG TPA: TIGR02677 family protein [Clostridia bacterium]|nr:TIGR02677 family protein [Clostridia bacterium]